MNYYDYLKENKDDDCVYAVIQYGCNSSPSDMWTPITNLFKNFNEAYEHFLKVSPNLNDTDNETEQYIYTFNVDKLGKTFEIENRVQVYGYHSGTSGNFAKRPFGAVITRCLIK